MMRIKNPKADIPPRLRRPLAVRLVAARLVLCFCFAPPPAFATEVQEVVSKGGVTAWLVEEHALPIVSARLVFQDSGNAYDPKGKEGRAQLAVGLLDEGAGDMDATQFSAALEDKAIRLGFGVDADGVGVRLAALSEHGREAFRLMGLALNRPRFDAAALERVRGQMQTALAQQEKSPGYLLQEQWKQLVYPGHPYANALLGTPASLKELTRADVQDYTRRYLARDRLLVAVVGDVTAAQLAQWLDDALGGLPAKAQPDVRVADAPAPVKAQQAVVQSDVPQTLVAFGTPGIPRNDPLFYEAYVMNHLIGGGGLSSLLNEEIREKRGLAYGVGTELTLLRHAQMWEGGFSTRNEKVGEAVAALKDSVRAFAEKGPEAGQLAEAKQFITGSFVLRLDSNMEIANYLISMQQYGLGRDYLERRNALMEAVTQEGVAKAARRIANMDRLQLVLVGKPALEKGEAK